MTDTSELNIHALLAERRQIAQIWGVADVLAIRRGLTEDQAWQVLQKAGNAMQHWANEDSDMEMVIADVADEMFPEDDEVAA